MSKDDYAKAIQSAEDKLRTNYSKQIKDMQAKIDELTPHEKSDSEIDFENRLKALEAKEKKIALQESLQSKSIDKSIADFLRDDVDIEGFNTVIENLVSDRVKAAGYKPTGHSSNESISNNITLKGLGREYVLRTFGTDVADKVYPQYKFENKRGTSKASDQRTLDISECLLYLVDKHGYTTEKDIVYLLSSQYRYETTETQIKKSLQEILLSYGLVRVKASKANKEKYGIPENVSYQCNVICRGC